MRQEIFMEQPRSDDYGNSNNLDCEKRKELYNFSLTVLKAPKLSP